MIKNTILLELNKALKNKLFLLAIFVGCAITLISVYDFATGEYIGAQATAAYEAKMGVKYNTGNATVFGYWVGVEAFSLSSAILYFVFPLLIAIPFGWSYCAERRSGYEKNMVLRSGKNTYYLAKYIAVFVSGGLTMVIPLVFQFLALCLFFPITLPQCTDLITLGIFPHTLFSWQFYTSPLLYVFLMCLLSFVFCGLLACLCYSASLLIKNRVIVTAVPFVALVLLKYYQKFLMRSDGTHTEINPLYFLNGQRAETNLQVIGIEILILLLITLGIIWLRGRKNEIY